MSTGSGVASARSGGVALSVHGPLGVLDLVVPAGASMWDVAREYAERSGLGSVPLMFSRTGVSLPPDLVLADCDIVPGTVLVAATSVQRPRRTSSASAHARPPSAPPGPLAVGWFSLAAAAAVLAGLLTAPGGAVDLSTPTVLVLLAASGAGVLPIGRYATLRALTAPVFAASAAYALLWDADPLHLPAILGGAALAAAVTAGVARALAPGPDEGLRVWIVAGGLVFVVGALTVVVGAAPPVVWSLLLLLSMMASRLVPLMAIDVPDHHLIDIERLAASAWSAREVPRGGARLHGRVGSGCGGGGAASRPDDDGRVGRHRGGHVRVRTAAPLLRARRHRPHRRALHGAFRRVVVAARGSQLPPRRAAGAVARELLPALPPDRLLLVAGGASLVALVLVIAAVATGRGWRSAWWSRRAEIAESLSGAAALASLVVSSGLFVMLWELTSANRPTS